MKYWHFTILLAILACPLISQAYEQVDNSIQRYLFVIGANNGGPQRAMLRYATNDAHTFSQVFTEMGGVKLENVIQLREPQLKEFKAGFSQLERKLLQSPKSGRTEVVVYYSGHADERGLQLGNETFAWKELRKAVDNLPAEVKITVLDACGSGAITRLKGGQRQPAFLVDASTDMKGYAFLTSSSDNEVAQESDRIGGSYFTQSLVTGMRGAADLNGDKKVTLSEAYQFAFNETLNRTQQTTGGAQHPSRDMKLSGTGDIVMTDLRETSAGLVLHKELEGRFFIRDENKNLIAELNKTAGKSLELGLAPGTYSVQMEHKGFYSADRIAIQNHGRREISKSDFKLSKQQYAQARGGTQVRSSTMDSLRYLHMTQKSDWDLGFLVSKKEQPWIGHQGALIATYSAAPMIGNQLSILTNIARQDLEGIQITTGFNFASRIEGAQITSGFNIAGYVNGIQISAGTNIADTIEGIQLGVINVGNYVHGHQISVFNAKNFGTGNGIGVINIAGTNEKHQFGVMNLGGTVGGAQLGVMNISGSTGGSQLGVMNVSGSTGGSQVGVMNVSGSTGASQVGVMNVSGSTGGVQAGIFNIAGTTKTGTFGIYNILGHSQGPTVGIFNIIGRADRPTFGLLNFVGNGFWNMSLSVNEASLAMTSLQVGSSYMHTNFHFSRELASDQIRGFGWGIGTQFGLSKRWWIGLNGDIIHLFESGDNEVWKKYGDENAYTQSQLSMVRGEYGFKILKHLAVFGGISANYLYSHNEGSMDLSPIGDYHGSIERGKQYFWPGAFLGVRFGKL